MGSHTKVDCWAAVDAAREASGMVEAEIPAGAFSVYDYLERYPMPEKSAEGQLKRLVELGIFSTGIQRQKRAGAFRKVRMYWPAETKRGGNVQR